MYQRIDSANKTSEAVGATVIGVAATTGFTVGDIVNFGEADGSEYQVTAIDAGNTITIERFGTSEKSCGCLLYTSPSPRD